MQLYVMKIYSGNRNFIFHVLLDLLTKFQTHQSYLKWKILIYHLRLTPTAYLTTSQWYIKEWKSLLNILVAIHVFYHVCCLPTLLRFHYVLIGLVNTTRRDYTGDSSWRRIVYMYMICNACSIFRFTAFVGYVLYFIQLFHIDRIGCVSVLSNLRCC